MSPEERFAEIAEFMRYAFEAWPRERARAQSQIAKRCSRCITSERCSALIDGLCNACLSDPPSGGHTGTLAAESEGVERNAWERELGQLLESHQGKASGRHDALVMFSGGKDSALLLHLLQQKYPRLRLLAVMVDNGFTSAVALANVQRVTRILPDLDYITLKPKQGLYRNTFRYALTHLNAGGAYACVERLGGDLNLDICRNFAASNGIPLLIHGGTGAQVQRNLGFAGYESPRSQERSRRVRVDAFVLDQIYDAEELGYWWDGSSWPEERIPRVLFPFCAWPYDEHFASREVVRLGLFEAGHENPLASNFDLLPVNLAVDICKLGYASYEPDFAQLIRSGKAARGNLLCLFESIEYLAGRGQFLPRCIADTLARLDLSHQQLGLPQP